MAEKLTIRVDADTSAAEAELKGLDRLADQTDLDVKVDSSGMENLADAAGGLPGPLGAAAGFMSGPGGVATGALAAAGALFAVASSAADSALEAESLQSAVGGTVEETSRLLAATGSVGIEYNDLLELISESNVAMTQNSDAARQLGVNLSGTPIQRFQELVDAVYSIEDPLKRAQTASKFFGEEGSKQLPKLIGLYGDLASALEAVPEGAVMSEEDVRNAQEFRTKLNGLKSEMGAFANQLGGAVIPAVTGFFGALNTGVDSFKTAWGGIGNLLSGDWDEFVNGEKEASTSTEELAAASEELGASLGTGIVDAFGAVSDAATTTATAIDTQREATDLAREANENLRDELFSTADTTLEAGRSWSDLNDELGGYRTNTEKTRADTERLEDAVFNYADAQVAAAGTTRDTTEGSKLYKDALGQAATLLGDEMTPQLQAYIDTALAVPDEAVTDIKGELDPSEFNEATRLADDLEQRQVQVKITADVSRFVTAAQNAVSNILGAGSGRTTQSTAARYVWRNGRYVETP